MIICLPRRRVRKAISLNIFLENVFLFYTEQTMMNMTHLFICSISQSLLRLK
jgi:hypothetical protein